MTKFLTSDEFTEEMKKLLVSPKVCVCPECGDGHLVTMHGLAGGGGIGVYILCMGCARVLFKCPDAGAAGECLEAYIAKELKR